eukprot:g1725.t1
MGNTQGLIKTSDCTLQGVRSTNEDCHLFAPLPKNKHIYFGGVFDGHGGKGCSKFCKERMPKLIDDRLVTAGPMPLRGKDGKQMIREMYIELDKAWINKARSMRDPSGSTAVTAMLDFSSLDLLLANAGDAQAVLSRAGRAINLSRNHKPHMPRERARIIAAGSKVHLGRLDGSLAVSRAIGDIRYKLTCNQPGQVLQVLEDGIPSSRRLQTTACTSLPSVYQRRLRPFFDEFLLLACDGLFDVMTEQEAVDFVRRRFTKIKRSQEKDVVKRSSQVDGSGLGGRRESGQSGEDSDTSRKKRGKRGSTKKGRADRDSSEKKGAGDPPSMETAPLEDTVAASSFETSNGSKASPASPLNDGDMTSSQLDLGVGERKSDSTSSEVKKSERRPSIDPYGGSWNKLVPKQHEWKVNGQMKTATTTDPMSWHLSPNGLLKTQAELGLSDVHDADETDPGSEHDDAVVLTPFPKPTTVVKADAATAGIAPTEGAEEEEPGITDTGGKPGEDAWVEVAATSSEWSTIDLKSCTRIQNIARELATFAIRKGSMDNVSIVILFFDWNYLPADHIHHSGVKLGKLAKWKPAGSLTAKERRKYGDQGAKPGKSSKRGSTFNKLKKGRRQSLPDKTEQKMRRKASAP